MTTTEQARAAIWEAIEEQGPYKLAARAGITPSMLYQFGREGGPKLGRITVNALRPLLPQIDDSVWLAAMGVEPIEPMGIEQA